MTDYLSVCKDWIINLGEEHNVDPVIFGAFYLTSKVLFFSALGWALKTFRAKKPLLVPLLVAAVCFSPPYVYLIIAGRNISIWIYLFVALVFIYSGFTVWKKFAAKAEPADVSTGS